MSIEEENTHDAGQAETGSELRIRLERLPGVGAVRAAKLAKLGLLTVRDALMHFPRDYRDFTGGHCFDELVEGEHASLAGTILSGSLRTISRGR